MKYETRAALAALNRAFYSRFAGDFARTRRTWPPGFDNILPYIEPAFNLLDLGCGNARLLAFLRERGWSGAYVGADVSGELLRIAAENAAGWGGGSAIFIPVDLVAPAWDDQLAGALDGVGAGRPDGLTSLAVLHHIPGREARERFMQGCASLLPPGGTLVISTWQFLLAPRLAGHVLPWSAAGIDEADLEPGDYLLSWGAGAAGQRYCASIDEGELVRLAAAAGLATAATFYADGHEGNLNLYGVFRPISATRNGGAHSAR
jgi:SAM-dependent methyltransferase